MQMENYLIRALAYGQQVRLLLADNTDLIRGACQPLRMKPKLLRTALGTTLACASLLAGTLKDGQRLSLKLKMSHRAYCIFADIDSFGNVRGYLSDDLLNAPPELLEGLSLADLIGDNGCIQIVKDIGMHGSFTGITSMPHRNIVDDLGHYFAQSEQTPTCFATHISYNAMGDVELGRAIWAQALPGATDSLIDLIQNRIHGEMASLAVDNTCQLLTDLFPDIEIVGSEPIRFFCGCCKEMFTPMLAALGVEQLEKACADGRSLEVVCHVCGSKYVFSPDELPVSRPN